MKAAVRKRYGKEEVINVRELEKPVPSENEVLIKVHAATVNRTDCHILWGRPFVMRFFTGLLKPRHSVTGSDFAGQIEAIGKNVTSFKPGDRVMGFGGTFGCGSHAQYLAFPETKGIVQIPKSISYEHASACIEGAFYALNSVRSLHPKVGQKAMVIGATGAIGSSTVQLLKYYGVSVTAVCKGENCTLVQLLGADRIIDYTTEDFTKDTGKYDYIFDSVGKSSFLKCKKLMKKDGIYTSSNGMINLLWAVVTPLFKGKKVFFLPPSNIKDGISFIKGLLENGNFKPVIDRKYSIDQIADAYKYVAAGQKIGNVVISMYN